MASRLPPFAYLAAGVASLGACSLLYSAATSSSTKPRVLLSPLSTCEVSSLSQAPYPPSDFIPGARDVQTPYGNMRIYEFGPEKAARKVLLVHGISNPSISLAGIASGLVDKGCRVMLLDLFGRGWSDAPGDLPYDDRLYTSQLFMALASSPLNWTGGTGGSFSIIGYSMGAAIAANFTSWFPALVEDLVLIAPAGLVRPEHRNWKTRLTYAGLLPDWIVAKLVKKRLRTNPNIKTIARAETNFPPESGSDPIEAEVVQTSTAPAAFGHPIDPEAVVRWQMDHHVGFVSAFFSSFVYAPVRGQHDRWKLIGMRLDTQRAAAKAGSFTTTAKSQSTEAAEHQGLRTGKVLMVLGKTDRAVFSDELELDAKAVLGPANLEIKVFDAGHEVPITHAEEIVDFVWEGWEAAQ
jgi:pimeloyl-ACP methyl ester carboxylesterase